MGRGWEETYFHSVHMCLENFVSWVCITYSKMIFLIKLFPFEPVCSESQAPVLCGELKHEPWHMILGLLFWLFRDLSVDCPSQSYSRSRIRCLLHGCILVDEWCHMSLLCVFLGADMNSKFSPMLFNWICKYCRGNSSTATPNCTEKFYS